MSTIGSLNVAFVNEDSRVQACPAIDNLALVLSKQYNVRLVYSGEDEMWERTKRVFSLFSKAMVRFLAQPSR